MTTQKLIESEPNLTQMIKSIEEGLPASNFKKLQDSLDLPDKDLAKYIRIPKSTSALRKKRGKFSLNFVIFFIFFIKKKTAYEITV